MNDVFCWIYIVEKNMGCLTFIGMCQSDLKDCSSSCKTMFGLLASGLCDKGNDVGQCICTHPCPANKVHAVKSSIPHNAKAKVKIRNLCPMFYI